MTGLDGEGELYVRGATSPHTVPGSPIDLPERRVGNFEIQHGVFAPGVEVLVVDMREAMLTGRRPATVVFDRPVRVHQLVERCPEFERIWMTDEPREVRQVREWIAHAQPIGRVLVGGLGLGVAARLLEKHLCRPTTVERSPEVVELAYSREQMPLSRVVVADVAAFLASVKEWIWACAFLDTWQGRNEATWWDEVMPLRRIIARRFGRRVVHCWAEDVMLGQVVRSIQTQGGRSWYYKALRPGMTAREARLFVREVGLPAWERRWGARIDSVREEMKADG